MITTSILPIVRAWQNELGLVFIMSSQQRPAPAATGKLHPAIMRSSGWPVKPGKGERVSAKPWASGNSKLIRAAARALPKVILKTGCRRG